ncbi:polysaccharide deacetylase family protein [Natrialbaceae archaeon A-gly3]
MRRRTYLAMATAGVLSLAGCAAVEDDPEETDPGDDGTDDEDTSPETFDDFENIDDWEVVAGSLEADTDNYYTGSQSARLEIHEGEDEIMANIVLELEEPIDCTEQNPGLAVQSENIENPSIQLYDADGARADFHCEVRPDMPFMRRNFGFAGTNGEGMPDLSAIEEIQIAFYADEDSTPQMWVDDLHFVPRSNTGAVMLQFDGGYETHHTVAQPTLEAYDMPATAFVPTGRIYEDEEWEPDRLSEAQLEDLSEAGWTIGSNAAHGSDLTGLEDRDPEEEITAAREWLEDHDYDGAGYFSYPQGIYDESTYDLVAENHDLAFTGRYGVQGRTLEPHLCSRVVNPSLGEATEILDHTAAMGGVTTLAYFRLEEDTQDAFADTMEYLNDRVEDGDLEVITPQEFEDEHVY